MKKTQFSEVKIGSKSIYYSNKFTKNDAYSHLIDQTVSFILEKDENDISLNDIETLLACYTIVSNDDIKLILLNKIDILYDRAYQLSKDQKDYLDSVLNNILE